MARKREVNVVVRFRWRKGKSKHLPEVSYAIAMAIRDALELYPITLDAVGFPFRSYDHAGTAKELDEQIAAGRKPDFEGLHVFKFDEHGQYVDDYTEVQ